MVMLLPLLPIGLTKRHSKMLGFVPRIVVPV